MRKRLAGDPFLGAIVLAVAGIIVTSIIYFWGAADSSRSTQVYKIEISSIYQVKPVSVGNAGWQIVLSVTNLGNREAVVEKIFVNEELVVETGLMHGESLSSTKTVGTNIPGGGVHIAPGNRATFYVWIGSKRYTSGTVVNIDIQRINQIEFRRTITLS